MATAHHGQTLSHQNDRVVLVHDISAESLGIRPDSTACNRRIETPYEGWYTFHYESVEISNRRGPANGERVSLIERRHVNT